MEGQRKTRREGGIQGRMERRKGAFINKGIYTRQAKH